MEKVTLPRIALLHLVFLLKVLEPGATMFDCNRECFLSYQDYQIVDSCDTVISALDCYSDNQAVCDADFNAYFKILQAMQDYQMLGCRDDNSVSTDSTTPPLSTIPPVSTATQSSTTDLLTDTVTQPVSTTPQAISATTSLDVALTTGAEMFDCNRECFAAYQDNQTVDSCDTVSAALECYSQNQVTCDSNFDAFSAIAQVMDDYQTFGCAQTALVPDSPTPEPSMDSKACPILSNEVISSISSMSSAVLAPDPLPPLECTMPRVSNLRQCSLFMDSHLRAFNSYRGGLEACSLPGSWYLFHHPKLTVEVVGTNFEQRSNHTRLTKVNVTFHTHECNPTTRTYTAFNSVELPSDFTPSHSGDATHSLRISLGADGSVVTLMDTRLNTTIVIRKYLEFLSVTLQVPREVSLESEGLCTGCPSHMYINITTFNNLYPTLCPNENFRVLDSCFDHGGVANQAELLGIQNNSYLEACAYSLFKIGRTLDVLTMFNAIADDAKLLLNVGEEPRTFHIIPLDPITSPLPSSNDNNTSGTTVRTFSSSPTEISHAFSHNSLLPLTLLSALLSAILVR